MLKSIAVLSAVTVAVYAQSNPLIPANISDNCRTFLDGLNSNTQVAACTTAMNTGLARFAPGSAATASASEIASALEAVCGSDACDAKIFSQPLTAFMTACNEELTTSSVPEVVAFYDFLYVAAPMKNAMCSKGDDGKWCVMSSNTLAGASASDIQSSLYTQNGQTVIPNTDSFSKYNVPFLLLTPELEKDVLCKACTRNVLTAYINHESSVPYAPGLGKSQLLQPQTPLFNAVKEKCGESFMDNQVKAAGGIGSNIIKSGAAAPSANAALSGLMAVAAGLVTLAVQAL